MLVEKKICDEEVCVGRDQQSRQGPDHVKFINKAVPQLGGLALHKESPDAVECKLCGIQSGSIHSFFGASVPDPPPTPGRVLVIT